MEYNGELIFSKKEKGRFPEEGEVEAKIESALEAPNG